MGCALCTGYAEIAPPFSAHDSMTGPAPSITHIHHGTVSPQRVLSLMDTGDVFLSRNEQSWFAECIRWGTWDNYSHVMLVDRVDENVVFLFESVRNRDGAYDVMTEQQTNGVRLCEAVERLEVMFASQHQFEVQVCLVKLQVQSPQQRQEIADRLHHFELQVSRRAFEQRRLSMVAAQLPMLFGLNHEDDSSFFCSELVAAAIRECQILPRELISSRVTPKMLGHAGRTFHRYWTTTGVYYQPVMHHFVLYKQQSLPTLLNIQLQQQTPVQRAETQYTPLPEPPPVTESLRNYQPPRPKPDQKLALFL